MPKTRRVKRRAARARPAVGVRLAVHVAPDGVRTRVPQRALRRLATYVLRAEGVRDAMLSVTLVSPAAIARLNRTYLRHRGSTDVITFAFDKGPRGRAVVGDVYICPAVARVNARAAGVTVAEELQRLVVHGTLHAVGWDHATGAGRERSPMWQRQERLLRAWQRAERVA